MDRWKRILALSVAFGSILIMIMDMVIFATGRASCHYAPYGEWIIELPLLLVGGYYLVKLNRENINADLEKKK